MDLFNNFSTVLLFSNVPRNPKYFPVTVILPISELGIDLTGQSVKLVRILQPVYEHFTVGSKRGQRLHDTPADSCGG